MPQIARKCWMVRKGSPESQRHASSKRAPPRRLGSRRVASADSEERVSLALPPLDDQARERAAEQDWELGFLDPEDPGQRAILIRLAHPDLDEAIEAGLEEVEVGGEPMNPRLHLAIHEVVATQVIDDDPPEAFATLQRLVNSG